MLPLERRFCVGLSHLSPGRKARSLLDYLTGTQRASWSSCRSHTRNLAAHGLATEKMYLLGYVAATPASMEQLAHGVHRRSARCLRRVFNDLPWEEDELGWQPSGPMCAVYLLISPRSCS